MNAQLHICIKHQHMVGYSLNTLVGSWANVDSNILLGYIYTYIQAAEWVQAGTGNRQYAT